MDVPDKLGKNCVTLRKSKWSFRNCSIFLLENKMNANMKAQDNYGLTALQYASDNGHLEIVKYLIEK